MTCPVGIAKIRAVTALGAARRCRAQRQPTPTSPYSSAADEARRRVCRAGSGARWVRCGDGDVIPWCSDVGDRSSTAATKPARSGGGRCCQGRIPRELRTGLYKPKPHLSCQKALWVQSSLWQRRQVPGGKVRRVAKRIAGFALTNSGTTSRRRPSRSPRAARRNRRAGSLPGATGPGIRRHGRTEDRRSHPD
jgi:hypothetical protein